VGHYYFDSSALAKRYVAERGSQWVTQTCGTSSGNTIYTVRITGAEIIAALFSVSGVARSRRPTHTLPRPTFGRTSREIIRLSKLATFSSISRWLLPNNTMCEAVTLSS